MLLGLFLHWGNKEAQIEFFKKPPCLILFPPKSTEKLLVLDLHLHEVHLYPSGRAKCLILRILTLPRSVMKP